MSGIAGKKARISFATSSGGSYANIAGGKSMSISIEAPSLDDSAYGVDWTQRLQGLKDAKISFGGSYREDDTTGQQRALSAMLNDTDVFVKVAPDGTTGFMAQVRVTKFQVDSPVDGMVTVACDMESTGAVTTF